MIPLRDNIPTSRFPLVTAILIVANLLVFGWQLSLSSDPGSSTDPTVPDLSQRDQATLTYGAVPYRLLHPGSDCGIETQRVPGGQISQDVVCQGTPAYAHARRDPGVALQDLDAPPWWVTVFTSMFMHAGILHIAFNMLFLWIFGNNVEDSMGRPRFLAFYLLAGIVSAYAQALLSGDSTVPAIGASGAIAGVLGGYLLLHPRARVLTLIFIIFFVTLIEIPAAILLAIWLVLQFVPAIGQVGTDAASGGGVAYWAHVGGFVFGLCAIRLFARRGTAIGARHA